MLYMFCLQTYMAACLYIHLLPGAVHMQRDGSMPDFLKALKGAPVKPVDARYI